MFKALARRAALIFYTYRDKQGRRYTGERGVNAGLKNGKPEDEPTYDVGGTRVTFS